MEPLENNGNPQFVKDVSQIFYTRRLCRKVTSSSKVFWFVLVRVTSWIVLVFMDKGKDQRSHTN